MKKSRTVNIELIFSIFVIMLISSLLSIPFLLIFHRLKLLSLGRSNILILPIVSMIVSIILGIMISTVAAHLILKPLNELIAATREVGKGNFTIKVSDLHIKNELGQLIRSFNQMTNELNSIEMFRKDFINNFSHEFKTPIVSIRGFAKQLQNPNISEQQREEYTTIIVKETERLAKMSTNVLLLTKLENQQIITDQKWYNLDEQIRSCILLLQMEWEQKNITFDLDLDNVSYYNNEELISQLWINIIGNSIKFSSELQTIAVSCKRISSGVEVIISDQGIGMSSEVKKHIYDKFYQGETSHHTEGNGLGLSLVNRIIQMCNGSIQVESALNHGTSFIIQLPIKK